MLWDFSGYHRYATEPHPSPDDPYRVMTWYRESSHFRKITGDLILDRILELPSAPVDFGTRLEPATRDLLAKRGRLLGLDEGTATVQLRGLSDAERGQLFDTRNRRRLEQALATALGRPLRLELQDASQAQAGAEDAFTQKVGARGGARRPGGAAPDSDAAPTITAPRPGPPTRRQPGHLQPAQAR